MKKIFSIILASIAMTSCVDTVILPDNKTVDEDFWQKKSEVESVVAAAYAQLRDATAIRNMVIWGDFRSDELVVTPSLPMNAAYKTALSQIYSLNVDTENEFTRWAPFYSAINYCNLILEKADNVVRVDPDYMQGDCDANKAQVLALRAFCYFYLTRVFHDIPVTPHAYMRSGDDFNAPQMAPAAVLDMCIADLEEAEHMAVSGSTYGDWRDKGLLNKDGINSILADIYLWRASVNRDSLEYKKVVEYCDRVIQAKKAAYELKPRGRQVGGSTEVKDYYLADVDNMYNDIFGDGNQNSEESIFELQFAPNQAANTGLDQAYNRFSNNNRDGFGYFKVFKTYGTVVSNGTGLWSNADDRRLFDYIYDANSSTAEQFSVRKFVASMGSNGTATSFVGRTSFNQNWIFYRLTDVMLMKAEALAQLYLFEKERATAENRTPDDTYNQQAFAICRFVNDRALPEDKVGEGSGKSSIRYTNFQDRMEELVLDERARELCFEGKRWFDLMRYNYRHTDTKADLSAMLTDSYVNNSSEFFKLALRKYPVPDAMAAKMRDERYLYMPIHQDEVELNTALKQNPVYKSTSKHN